MLCLLPKMRSTAAKIFVCIMISSRWGGDIHAAPVWQVKHLRWPGENSKSGQEAGAEKLPRIFQIKLSKAPPSLDLRIAGDKERQQKVEGLFAPLRAKRQYLATHLKALGEVKSKKILALFKPGQKYTYVITDAQVFFAPIDKIAGSKLATKHYFIGNYPEVIFFAGECWINEAQQLVVDNNSGTYRPGSSMLPMVASFLGETLGFTVNYKTYI